MFDELLKKRKEFEDRVKYNKELGWNEYDDNGNQVTALIYAVDMEVGYGVIRQGSSRTLLYHCWDQAEAVEYAVDEARRQISEHELKQAKRPLPIEDKKQKKD